MMKLNYLTMCAAVVFLSFTAQARVYYWEGAVSSEWSNLDNWKCDYNDGIVDATELPGEADNNGGSMRFGESPVDVVNQCVYNYEMPSQNYTGNNWSAINVGLDEPATITFNGGVWYQSAALGIGAGSFGQWIHNGGLYSGAGKEVHVGSQSQGYLEISGGEISTARVRVCANSGTDNSEAVVKGGKITATQWLNVGQNATGSMTVLNGTVETPDLSVQNDSVLTIQGGLVQAGTISFAGENSFIDLKGGLLETSGLDAAAIQAFIDAGQITSTVPDSSIVYEDMGEGVYNIYAESPYLAITPSPADNSIDLPVEVVDLSWGQEDSAAGLGITYEVHLGTEPENLPIVKYTTDQSDDFNFNAENVDNGTQYFWRVDAREPNDIPGGDPYVVSEGPVWTFETVPAIPEITSQSLDDTLVPQGGSASFSVEAEGITDMQFQWYKCNGVEPAFDEGTGLPLDTPVGDPAGPLASPATNSLDLTDIQVGDEGYYYCQIWNESGVEEAVYSDTARLVTERITGHWKMDDDLTDFSGSGFDASHTDPPAVFAAGKDGNALSLINDPNHVQVPGSEDAFNFYHLGLTVNFWMKSDLEGWHGLVCKQDRDGYSPWRGLVIETNGSGLAVFTFREVGSISSDVAVTDGQWHMISATYDGETGEMKLYVDGEEKASAAYPESAPLLTDNPLVIGAEQVTGATPLEGQIDDVRVYTYAKPDTEILDLYNNLTEPDKQLCLLEYGEAVDVSGPEGEPDCMIDMHDFAYIAVNWLNSGIYPVSE
ncbi:LamG-like jellyroll fold domain-containing protein [Sedimentisphaera salicampi]|uniref:LamG-like jellyroll fold domain-containing protein n=1 Tax=Sedimentisphaera salicampi TaxID=1941349 RepID=UPI000B9B1E30|nr:LamG-like jellyroll fold domain-containing protein [Sedimentisphaera salicampi]OXU15667.1 hypothetical protein SMSP1_00563 [Sedimentisphaera salicampi]